MKPAGPARVERRLAAILAADMAGYSRLIGADEEGTLGRLKGLRGEVVDPKIAEHVGRIVKTTGDGLLVEFASVVDALRCAAELQAAMAESNNPLPADKRIEFRSESTRATSSSRRATSLATASTSPPGSKAWPSRAAFASRPAFRRMLRASSTSPSKTSASRVSRTSLGRCASSASGPARSRRLPLPRRFPTSRRSRCCPSPI